MPEITVTDVQAQKFIFVGGVAVDFLEQGGEVLFRQFRVKAAQQRVVAFRIPVHVVGDEDDTVEEIQFFTDLAFAFRQVFVGQGAVLAVVFAENIQPDIVKQRDVRISVRRQFFADLADVLFGHGAVGEKRDLAVDSGRIRTFECLGGIVFVFLVGNGRAPRQPGHELKVLDVAFFQKTEHGAVTGVIGVAKHGKAFDLIFFGGFGVPLDFGAVPVTGGGSVAPFGIMVQRAVDPRIQIIAGQRVGLNAGKNHGMGRDPRARSDFQGRGVFVPFKFKIRTGCGQCHNAQKDG